MYTPGQDIYGSREHQAFRETVRKFVQAELAPRAREFDKLGRIDKSLYHKMGDLGLLGIRYDPRYGGQGLDYSFHAVFVEELTLCDNSGISMGITVHTDMATPSLHRFGSEELKQKYLVPAIRGEQVSAIAVTEPGAGSDVSGIKTRAVRDGDYWVINGSKMYITNAATADWLCLLAVTDPEAGYGSTDCGNVSQAIPTIHPYIRISPDGVPGHSREFAEWAKSPLARAGFVAAAKALAMTAVDLLASPEDLKKAKDEFAAAR